MYHMTCVTCNLSITPTGIATDPPPDNSPTLHSSHRAQLAGGLVIYRVENTYFSTKTGCIHNVAIHNIAGNILNVLSLSWATF